MINGSTTVTSPMTLPGVRVAGPLGLVVCIVKRVRRLCGPWPSSDRWSRSYHRQFYVTVTGPCGICGAALGHRRTQALDPSPPAASPETAVTFSPYARASGGSNSDTVQSCFIKQVMSDYCWFEFLLHHDETQLSEACNQIQDKWRNVQTHLQYTGDSNYNETSGESFRR